MAVFKINHSSNYTVISNNLIRDTRLSNQALGLMVKMLSLPPEWDYSISGLVSICKDGQGRVESALKELKEYNYLIVQKVFINGRISKWEYQIYEESQKSNTKYTIEESYNENDQADACEIPVTQTVKASEKFTAEINDIVSYLNLKAGTNYRTSSETTKKYIRARLGEGFNVEDFKTAIDNKCSEWLGTEMAQYLRPETLFSSSKFESYVNAKPRVVTTSQMTQPNICLKGKIYNV